MNRSVERTAGRRRSGLGRALVPVCALAATLGLVVAGGAVADDPGVGKVLVFTGTAGDPNDATADAVAAIEAAGEANDFGVDVTAAAADINAGNLADYRAVAFVHSSGEVLSSSQAAALEDYVNDGGGFLGIGETAELQPDDSFFDTLIGARPDEDSSSDVTSQDVEYLDRVHPATRDLPALNEGHEDAWYEWDSNPTGTVHTVARARFGAIPTADEFQGEVPDAVTETNILDEGESVTNDAIKNDRQFLGGTDFQGTNSNRAVSWCRDIEHGRSFYTAMGRTSDAYTDELEGHLEGAVLWAAGLVRGNCKATIDSSYQATRLTPQNPSGTHDYVGELVDMDIADNGLVFYVGRAACFAGGGGGAIANWNDPNTGRGCGTLHVWDPGVAGDDTQNPEKITHVNTFEVFGNRGGGAEVGLTGKSEHGLTGIALDPDFTNGRPYIYLDYWPYDADDLGPGFMRHNFLGERRTSRFTFDLETKSLVEGSERVVFHYLTQMYACCHHGGSMAFDSEGNLHIPSGDFVGNNPNSANGGYQQAWHGYTIPPYGTPEDPARGDCSANDNRDLVEGCYGEQISYGDARTSSGSTNTYDGSMIRIKPVADLPEEAPALPSQYSGVPDMAPDGEEIENATPADRGLGTHYTLPDANSPNGPNMYALNSPEVQQGLAKPEIYSMGLRNFYSVEIDPETDLISAASVGPDQNSHNNTWGLEGHSVHTLLPEAGNYLGWPYCWGNGIGYRKKLPQQTGGGAPAPVGTPGTIPGPPYDGDGQPTGGWNNCFGDTILNDSPWNTGIDNIPSPRTVNFWWGRSNLGCPDYRRDQNLLPLNFIADERFQRCPWAAKSPGGGGQAGMTGGFYRMPETADPDTAWPEYWVGRWFLFNYSSPNTTRHAVLLPEDPDNTSDAIAVDSLRGFITSGQLGNNAILGHEFGPDGSLYLVHYGGSFFGINNNNTSVWRYSYVGGPSTPNPDPQATSAEDGSQEVEFSKGRSGGVAYHWDFGDGNTSTEADPTHAYQQIGDYEATLTVTYADGEEVSETIEVTALAEVPVNVAPPELKIIGKPSDPVVGAQLRCDPGKWTSAGNYQITWLRDGEEFDPTEPPRRHDTGPEDAGTTITCEVTRTNRNAVSDVATSNAIAISGG